MNDLEKQKIYEETKDNISERLFQIRQSYDAPELGEESFEDGCIVYTDDHFEIETVLNLKINTKYFKFIRYPSFDKFGSVCRIRIDRPEYILYKTDIILNHLEKEKLIQILKSDTEKNKTYWEKLIYMIWRTYKCFSNDSYSSIIPKMPDYQKLEEI